MVGGTTSSGVITASPCMPEKASALQVHMDGISRASAWAARCVSTACFVVNGFVPEDVDDGRLARSRHPGEQHSLHVTRVQEVGPCVRVAEHNRRRVRSIPPKQTRRAQGSLEALRSSWSVEVPSSSRPSRVLRIRVGADRIKCNLSERRIFDQDAGTPRGAGRAGGRPLDVAG